MIRVPEVRLIGPNNENVGVVTIQKALEIARDADLDLALLLGEVDAVASLRTALG